jgi:O-antigen/teichoic acid export membrane protein
MPATEPLRLLAGGLAVCGLREGIGPMFYAKGRPSLDIYLNSVRLVLIVATVGILSRFGLVGVSAGMSIVEAMIAVAGIYSACRLIELRMTGLFSSIMPGLRLALCCAAAAIAGKAFVMWFGIQGPVALLVLAFPTAVTFLLLEKSEVNRIVIQLFGRRAVPVVQA